MLPHSFPDDFQWVGSFNLYRHHQDFVALLLATKAYVLLVGKKKSFFEDIDHVNCASGIVHGSNWYVHKIRICDRKTPKTFVVVCYFKLSPNLFIQNPFKVDITEVNPRTSEYKKWYTYTVSEKRGKYFLKLQARPVCQKASA